MHFFLVFYNNLQFKSLLQVYDIILIMPDYERITD